MKIPAFTKTLLALVVLIGGQAGTAAPASPAPLNPELQALTGTSMDVAQADPRADFSRYRQLVLEPLGFDKLRIVQPAKSVGRKDFALDERDRERLRKQYMESATKRWRERGFEIVDAAAAGPDTLRLAVDMVELKPNAPKEDSADIGGSARDRTYSRGAGSMKLAAEFRDAASGQVLAVFSDKMTDLEVWGPNNSVTNLAAAGRAFSTWNERLGTRIGALAQKK